MNKVLLVDAGNSGVKFTTVEKNRKRKVFRFQDLAQFYRYLQEMESAHKSFDKAYFSSVLSTSDTEQIQRNLGKCSEQVTSARILGYPFFKSDYKLNELGEDRIAALLYTFFNQIPKAVIIDAGTALTIDFYKHSGNFLGGYILSGLYTELLALHEKTSALPLINEIKAESVDEHLPKNTREAMIKGVLGVKVMGIEALIVHKLQGIQESIDDWQIFLTGGDALLIKEYMSLQGKVVENMVLDGLYLLAKGSA